MKTQRFAPAGTVRGTITSYIRGFAKQLNDGATLEIGSRLPAPSAWWADNRAQLHDGQHAWVGIDFQDGHNVDRVMDAHALDFPDGTFTSVLCSEVLEHVRNPQQVVHEAVRVLKPGGVLIVTTLTAFPLHGYPDDYWRFTPSGLQVLFETAGLRRISTRNEGSFSVTLKDHDERRCQRDIPLHVFGSGAKPA